MIELLLIMAVLGGAMWYFWGLVSGAFADGQKSMGGAASFMLALSVLLTVIQGKGR